MSSPEDLRNASLLDLFRMEVEAHTANITSALLALERDASAKQPYEEAMRGAHSIKGAARIVNRTPGVRLAHAMEECFETARRQELSLDRQVFDQLLRGVDLLRQIAQVSEPEFAAWESSHAEEIGELAECFQQPRQLGSVIERRIAEPPRGQSEPQPRKTGSRPAAPPADRSRLPGRVTRVTAANLDRLLGLAGESMVASRWLDGFTRGLGRIKRQQKELESRLASLAGNLSSSESAERLHSQLSDIQKKAAEFRDAWTGGVEELDSFNRRLMTLCERLHYEVLDCRMRPFGDGVRGFPRLLRDLARSLGREARLEIIGESTPVDREILERMESPLGHLLRNALDHGIEPPDERERAGKSREAMVRMEARHSGGMLFIEVSDDGRGMDVEHLRRKVIERNLAVPEVAARFSDAELLEFTFLPGFTLRETVTEISGRGVGLDVVKNTVKEVGGTVRITSRPGKGTKFQLRLPLTLSVLRGLLVEIAGEPYAIPLARISSVRTVPRESIESAEGREHFAFAGQQVGLVPARQILGFAAAEPSGDAVAVVILGDANTRHGLVVDRFLGEHELVVRTLDPRLGKVKDISAAALMPDQSIALIIDVDDLLRSVEKLVSVGRIAQVRHGAALPGERRRKRVLVVDDSLTVRELERKLIESRGYEVTVAVDGMDGWNSVRAGQFDLVVTDVDMPRLDGIELVTLIKRDARLHATPVVIVSYKDREEDRRRGLDAGADYFLTKGSFQDETLLRAVADLIGEPEE